jgi:hypothetical protein
VEYVITVKKTAEMNSIIKIYVTFDSLLSGILKHGISALNDGVEAILNTRHLRHIFENACLISFTLAHE